jgi:hypothetical protein
VAVSIVQSTTAATGATASGTLSVTLSGVVAGHGCLAVLVSSQPIYVASLTSGTLLLSAGGSAPYFYVYRSNSTGGLANFNATFGPGGTTAAYYSVYLVETTAASFTATAATGTTLVSATGATPPSWLPLTGDLPFGFFASDQGTTVTPQSGWTQVANLNSSNPSQLEVQTGPTATSSPQSVTAQATFAAGHNYAGALVTASASSPYVFVSQEVAETVDTDTANARFSQQAIETVDVGTVDNAHMSQQAVETIGYDTALMRQSQWVMEVIIPLNVRISQVVVETVDLDTAKVRLSQLAAEVIFSNSGARRRGVDDEMFTL